MSNQDKVFDFLKENPKYGYKANYIAKKLKLSVRDVYNCRFAKKSEVSSYKVGKSVYYMYETETDQLGN